MTKTLLVAVFPRKLKKFPRYSLMTKKLLVAVFLRKLKKISKI